MNHCITVKELPENLKELSEVIGVEALLKLVDSFGGESIYINKRETVDRWSRNCRIRSEFTGANYRELARLHGLTVAMIRNIVDNKHKTAKLAAS
ncbi:MAG: Mor transcription activator family protein [Candidatus Margulisiibacteriota bacterium]